MAQQLAGPYTLYQRFWIYNPDAAFVAGGNAAYSPGTGPVGPDSAMLDDVRVRLQDRATDARPLRVHIDILEVTK
jgi:hypothetical protein